MLIPVTNWASSHPGGDFSKKSNFINLRAGIHENCLLKANSNSTKKTNWFKEKVIFWEYLFVSKCWYKFSSKSNRVPIYILTNNSSAHFLKSISLILIQFRVKKTFEENPISARGEKTNFSRLHWDQRPKSKILNWQTENKLFCGLMSINIKITLVDFVKCENVWKLADMGWQHLVRAVPAWI